MELFAEKEKPGNSLGFLLEEGPRKGGMSVLGTVIPGRGGGVKEATGYVSI